MTKPRSKKAKKLGRPKRTKGAAKKDRLDIVFSLLIRERADWICEKCSKGFRHDAGKLHCSHFYSRSRQSVRFDPANAAAHCVSCHWQLGHAPLEFGQWIEFHLGKYGAQELQIRANRPLKRSQADKEDLYQDMKAELERMQSDRKAGVTGRIEFMEAA